MEISTDSPTFERIISGQTFSIPAPFAEGHQLTANEATALNQTFFENIRNGTAKKVADLIEGGGSVEDAQALVNDYISAYEFGARRGGQTRLDPVEREAWNLAEAKAKEILRSRGTALKDVTDDELEAMVQKLLDKVPAFYEIAKENVARKNSIASAQLSKLLDDGEEGGE